MPESPPRPLAAPASQNIREERIDATAAAALHGLPLSSFNAARREMQLVYDRGTGRLSPYPGLSRDGLGNELTLEERRRQEVAFDATHILVVPEWGGIKYPRSSWTYSRAQCEAIGRQLPGTLERPAWQRPE